MKKTLFIVCAILLTLNFASPTFADIRIKKKSNLKMPNMPAPMKNPMTGEMMDPGKLPDTTVLIKGARMLTETRTEASGKKMIMTELRQCDLGRELAYTNNAKTYTVTYFNASGAAQKDALTARNVPVEDAAGGGVVTYSITYTDTGERAQLFGYPARHVKRVITMTPSANACETKKMQIETDGWYIDLPSFSCPTFAPPEMPAQKGELKCRDKIEFKMSGKADNGFPVKETMTIGMDGMPAFTKTEEVTEISNTELDAMLFDAPPGYTEDKSIKNPVKPSAANKQNISPPNQTATPNSFPANANLPQMPTTAIAEAPLQPKRAGVIRIGIAKPNIKMPDEKKDYTAPLELSSAVRDSLINELNLEKIEAIRLSTDAPETEGRQKECDYIFYANVTQKHGGGGMFGKMLAMGAMEVAGSLIPGVGMIAGTVGSIAMSQTMGKTAKAKDEFTFDYKVTGLDNAVLSQSVTKAKTKKDGEDVLTPQVQQAAKSVLAEIVKKK